MTDSPTPDDDTTASGEDLRAADEGEDLPDDADQSVQEIARSHPSAGDDSEPEGVEQRGNTEGDERAADGGTGAGEDYAGSGF